MASEAFIIVIQQQGAKEAAKDMESLATAGSKASASTTGLGAAADKAEKHLSAVRGTLALMRNALVLLSFTRVVTGIVGLVDEFINMQSKLNLVTSSLGDSKVAMSALLGVAQETRAPLDSTVTLFTRLARSTSNLKLTNADLIAITRELNQAFVISGATADETHNAIIQLTQGLSLGILRGQDLRSVTEFGSRVAQIFTDEINKQGLAVDSTGKKYHLLAGSLYTFTQQHKNILTTTLAVKAFQDSIAPVAEEFTHTSRTIGQAWTQLSNVFEIFFGNLATGSGTVSVITSALDFLTRNISAVTLAVIAFVGAWVGLLVIRTFLGLAGQLINLVLGIGSAFRIAAVAFRAFAIAIGTFTGAGLIIAAIAAAIFLVIKVLQAMGVTWDDVWEAAKTTIAAIIAAIQVLGDIFYNIFEGLALVAVRAFNKVSTNFTAFLNLFRDEQKKAFVLPEPEAPKNFGTVGEDFSRHFTDSKKSVDDFVKFVNDAVKGGISDDAIAEWLKKQNALAKGFDGPADEISKKLEGLANQLESFIARVSPAFDVISKMDKLDKLMKDIGAEKGGPARLAEILDKIGGKEELVNRVTRAEIGLGNADTDLAEKTKLLDDYLKKHAGSLAEVTFAQNEAVIAAAKFNHTLEGGVKSAEAEQANKVADHSVAAAKALKDAYADINSLQDYTDAQKVLGDELKKHPEEIDAITRAMIASKETFLAPKTDFFSGFQRGALEEQKRSIDDASIAAAAYGNALKEVDAGHTFEVTQRTLNQMLAEGKLEWSDYTDEMRKAQQEMLSFSTDAEGGFRSAMLDIQSQIADTAKTAKEAFTTAFNDINDSLVDFFDTGSFNLAKFSKDLTHNLNKLAVQNVFAPSLAEGLGFGSPDQPGSGGGGFAGLIGGIFGAPDLTGLASAKKPTGGVGDPLHVIMANTEDLGNLFGNGNKGFASLGANGEWNPGAQGFPEIPGGDDFITKLGNVFDSSNGGGGFLSNLSGLFTTGVSGLGNAIGSLIGGGSSGGGILGALGIGGGGAGAGGGLGGLFSGAMGLLGLAGGGGFDVGGQGGTDSQLVAFRASPDEHVSVQTPAQQNADQGSGSGPVNVAVHVYGVSDVNSFKASEGQVSATAGAAIGRAMTRNGRG